MYAVSIDMQPCTGRVEAFVFQLSQRAAVHSIGIVRLKSFHVKMIHPSSHFFIRSKGYPDGAVFLFRMGEQRLGHCHDFRNSCFIVCA